VEAHNYMGLGLGFNTGMEKRKGTDWKVVNWIKEPWLCGEIGCEMGNGKLARNYTLWRSTRNRKYVL
jgi:hypothetical protein